MATKTYDQDPEQETKKNCLEDWEKDLKEVKSKLNMTQQTKTGIGKQNANAIAWFNKLNMYWESLKHTNELLDNVSVQLELFSDQTHLICSNIECSRMAIQILFCKVKKVFECTDQLRECLADFFMKVECLGDENISAQNSMIYACLKGISDKLEQAVAKQFELMKKLIEVLQCIEELEEAICDDECGIRAHLDYLSGIFSREGDEEVRCDFDVSCKDEIECTISIPLDCDEVYQYTRRQYELAENEKVTVKASLDQICKEYEALASCERSLREAVENSKAAQECK